MGAFTSALGAQENSPNAAITGIVINSVTKQPIAGATIQAIRGGKVRYTATTNARGIYNISSVEPSNYTLVASASGYQTKSVGVKPCNCKPTVVNFELVPLGGTISGTVTDAMTTFPISGAKVSIFQTTTLIATVTANGSGFYSVPNLAPGSYIISATATGYETDIKGAIVQVGATETVNFQLATTPGTISGTVTDLGTMSPIQGALIEVYEGSLVIGFADTDAMGNYTVPSLPPGSYTLVASANGYEFDTKQASVLAGMTTVVDFALNTVQGTIAGTVTDSETGLPIEGASIQISDGLVGIVSILTDADGNYNVSGFSPGRYIVTVSVEGYQTQSAGAIVLSNNTTIVDFSLAPDPGNIEGTVIDSMTLNPIPSTVIHVRNGPVLIATALTDADGNYSTPNLDPTNYAVIANASGYQAAFQRVSVPPSQTANANFTLNSQPGAISGTVTDAGTMNPIPDATVSLYQGENFLGYILTDANGNYSILNLASGDYFVVTSADGYETQILPATVTANMTTTVDFALGTMAGSISGTIREACNGEALAGALILVDNGLTVVGYDVSSESGTYLIPGIPAGNYTVSIRRFEYLETDLPAVVVVNTDTIVNSTLIPASFPPEGITGAAVNNVFLTYTDRVHVIKWRESPGLCVIGYNIFRNGELIGFVSSSSLLEYNDRGRKNQTDVYSVEAVNALGLVSSPVSITLN